MYAVGGRVFQDLTTLCVLQHARPDRLTRFPSFVNQQLPRISVNLEILSAAARQDASPVGGGLDVDPRNVFLPT